MIRALARFHSLRPRLTFAIGLGVVGGIAMPLPDGNPMLRALIGWNIACYLYLALTWLRMIRADDSDVRSFAEREDQGAFAVLTAVSLAAVMSIVAIVFELFTTEGHGPLRIGLTGATVVGAWMLIPTVFAMHYAHEFYRAERGSPTLIFPDTPATPDYWDFLYFSFTIAVAGQTADVGIGTRSTRKSVMAQAVMSFFFNAAILALTINVAAGLVAR